MIYACYIIILSSSLLHLPGDACVLSQFFQACQVSLSLSEPAKEVMKLLQNAQLSWSNAGITVTGQKLTVGSGVVFTVNLRGPEN